MVSLRSFTIKKLHYTGPLTTALGSKPALERSMTRAMVVICAAILLQACFSTKYELKKYYKDPNSPAARIMGGTYAGVVETFNSMDACLQMKEQVARDDRNIGYTNSRFVCDEK
tara:strand:- start:490 stop:831 length:342 start_codon:yes stop_codon:yes gene_type:complete